MKNFLDELNLTDICPNKSDLKNEKHTIEHDILQRITVDKKTDKKN